MAFVLQTGLIKFPHSILEPMEVTLVAAMQIAST